MLAMKLEAFKGRGKRDYLGSRDFADIVTLLDGRAELLDEVAGADEPVRSYIRDAVAQLLADPRLMDGLAGAMRGDAASQERVDLVILPRLRNLVESAG
jgi:hypothetical protein